MKSKNITKYAGTQPCPNLEVKQNYALQFWIGHLRFLLSLAVAFFSLCFGGREAFGAGATTPFTTVEAESGSVTGGATVVNFSGPPTWIMSPEQEASGRSYVKLDATGASVTWTNNTGQSITAINIRASVPPAPNRTNSSTTGSPNTFTLDLYVNGTFRQAVTLTSKQTWLYQPDAWLFNWAPVPDANNPYAHVFWDEAHTFITGAAVAPGSTIMLRKNSANTSSFYYVDCVDLEAPPAPISQPANSLSIVSYGAQPNNLSFDSRSSIQDCINAAVAQGKTAWVPAGTYYVAGDLLTTNVTLAGAGPWYSMFAFHIGGLRVETSSTFSTVKDLQFKSDSPAGGGGQGRTGFAPSGSNWLIDNVWIEHQGQAAVWGGGTNGTIRNCRFNNTYGDGININNVDNQGGTVGNYITVQNTHIRGSTDDGIAINASGESPNNMQSPTLLNNTIVAPAWANCIGIYGGVNDVVQGNLCKDGIWHHGMSVGSFGDTNQPLVGAVVKDNTIVRCGSKLATYSFYIGKTTTAMTPIANVFVGGNTVLDSYFNAIGVGSGTNVAIQNNTVNNPVNSGIVVNSGDVGNIVMLGNIVTNLQSGQLPFVNNSNPANLSLANPPPMATSYSSMSGVTTGNSVEGYAYVTDIHNGEWTAYNNVNMTGVTGFLARVSSGGLGGNIEIRLDSPTGTQVGWCAVPVTGGWQNWVNVNASISGASGTHTVYLKYTGGTGATLFNLVWFAFKGIQGQPGALADGTYKVIARHSGKGLDVTGQATANGSPVEQWTYGAGANQKWIVASLGSNQYRLTGVQSNRVLDVSGASMADGAAVHIWDWLNGNNQKWTINPLGAGYYSVLAVHSGKALEVTGGPTATQNGALVDQWTYGGGTNQQWSFLAP